jgi:hypothetical protein
MVIAEEVAYNLHPASLVRCELGYENKYDAHGSIDGGHGERIDDTYALDEDGAVDGNEVLPCQLQEDVYTQDDECAF